MKKSTYMRTLMIAGLVALVAVPTIASARQEADDPVGHTRQEDRQADRREDRQQDNTATTQSTETVVDGIKVETGATLPNGAISMEEARVIAQGQRPDSIIFKVEIEAEDGTVVYSFRFTDDGRVDVRASDGTVNRVEDTSSESPTPANSDDSPSDDSSGNDDNDDEYEANDDNDDSDRNRH